MNGDRSPVLQQICISHSLAIELRLLCKFIVKSETFPLQVWKVIHMTISLSGSVSSFLVNRGRLTLYVYLIKNNMLFPATSKDLLLQQQHYCEWPHSFTVLIPFWQQIPSACVCFLKKSISPVWGVWIEAAHWYLLVLYLLDWNCNTWWLYCLLAGERVHYLQDPKCLQQVATRNCLDSVLETTINC